MWYFSWVLGVTVACFFGILNALWLDPRLPPIPRADD